MIRCVIKAKAIALVHNTGSASLKVRGQQEDNKQ